MTRVEFTHQICNLLAAMMLDDEHPVIDFVKRSDEEQMRLFILKKSKCDGIKNQSQHQFGKAMDIYFVEGGKTSDPIKGWSYWHDYWVKKGGKPELLDENGKPWDRAHFEG